MTQFLMDIFNSPGGVWAALFDLVIVYYLVYIVLRLVRGTKTVPMAVGLGTLVLLYVFSKQLGFSTTRMLLDQFMSVAVIFALIIFQDDIRRALVRVGNFARFSKARENAVLEEVTKAAAMMTKKNIGGLIVFEREAGLDEYILEAGTNLESSVSRELLYTIFIPMMENPLHDGAVIIRDYELKEAGVFLPLTNRPISDKSLGTRHRAAIGITEQTDAVSVVISEERGTISVCTQGEIVQNLDATGLKSKLMELFATTTANEPRNSSIPAPPPGDGSAPVVPTVADEVEQSTVDDNGSDSDHSGEMPVDAPSRGVK